ncbi:MAG: DUF2203 domain-containing protein [Candidatus Eiseniibacteriota bacterium]
MSEPLFTPARANRALPLVRRIVADILDRSRELRGRAALADDPRADPELRALEREIGELVSELRNLGCEFKDPSFEAGLVDFPAEIGGRPVWLCWRSDEDQVTHYHGRDEGFASRKRIPDHLLRDPE